MAGGVLLKITSTSKRSMSGDLQVNLSRERALVLFEFLSRFSNSDTLAIEDAAKNRVLWDLTRDLEKQLAEPLSRNHSAALEDARAMLRDPAE